MIATTLAGIMAVLAPTVGPVVGGWITDTWSWHWLFLINVIPGIIAAAVTPLVLPRTKPCLADLVTLDGHSLALMAIALADLVGSSAGGALAQVTEDAVTYAALALVGIAALVLLRAGVTRRLKVPLMPSGES